MKERDEGLSVPDDEKDEHSEITHYESSGIDERHGVIPKWLIPVYAVLLIWMVYYLIRFWTDKG